VFRVPIIFANSFDTKRYRTRSRIRDCTRYQESWARQQLGHGHLLAIGEYLYADIPLIVWRRSSSLTPEGHDGSVEANHHRRGSGTVASIIAYDRQVASAPLDERVDQRGGQAGDAQPADETAVRDSRHSTMPASGSRWMAAGAAHRLNLASVAAEFCDLNSNLLVHTRIHPSRCAST
jgi:hypothetical protein